MADMQEEKLEEANTPMQAASDEGEASKPAGAVSAPSSGDDGEEEGSGRDFYSLLKALPDAVQRYILSKKVSDIRNGIYEKYGLADEARDVAFYTESQAFFGEIPVDQFPDVLWNRLPWKDDEEEKARQFALDILGHILLPAQAHVGDVVGQIIELGGDPSAFPEEQLELRQVTYEDGINEIMELVEPEGMDKADESRLRHIIDSHLRDVRDAMETGAMLTKPRKTGGLELPEAEAARIMDVVAQKRRMTKYVEQVIETVHGEEGGEHAHEHREYTPEEIRSIYLGSADEQKAIAKAVEAVATDTKNDPEAIRQRLYDSMYPEDLTQADRWTVVGQLIALVQAGGLLAAIREDERYRNIVRNFLEVSGKGGIAEYETAPLSKRSVDMLLQIILCGLAGMDENDSARYGLRIAGMLKKQGQDRYSDLAAFDLDEGKFAWTDPLEM